MLSWRGAVIVLRDATDLSDVLDTFQGSLMVRPRRDRPMRAPI